MRVLFKIQLKIRPENLPREPFTRVALFLASDGPKIHTRVYARTCADDAGEGGKSTSRPKIHVMGERVHARGRKEIRKFTSCAYMYARVRGRVCVPPPADSCLECCNPVRMLELWGTIVTVERNSRRQDLCARTRKREAHAYKSRTLFYVRMCTYYMANQQKIMKSQKKFGKCLHN